MSSKSSQMSLRCAVCAAALVALSLLAGCGGSGPRSAATPNWPPIVVTCDSTALSQLERVYAKRKALQGLLEAYEVQHRAFEAGRTMPGLTDQQEELEKTTSAALYSCAERMGSAITGLDHADMPLVFPGYTAADNATAVVMSVSVNYELRTHRSDFAPVSEIRADMADVARQFVPAILSAYPRLQYVELHAHQPKKLGWTVATMGVTRHAAAVLGDSVQLYIDACIGKFVPGLGYSAEVEMRDFTFKPNEALVKAGKI